jgi:hypothetical protein
MIDELERLAARRGQRVKPRLKSFLAWLKAHRIESGQGIRIRRTINGTIVSANIPNPVFLGAFTVSLVEGGQFSVARGFVNGIEPKINGVPITGQDEKPRPTLKVPQSFDQSGRAWALVEVKINEKTLRIDQEDPESVVIKADKSLASGDRLVGRHPIAMFVQADGGQIIKYQLSYFSLRHAFNKRHFFVPA